MAGSVIWHAAMPTSCVRLTCTVDREDAWLFEAHSVSAGAARRALALRLETLPRVAAALGAAEIRASRTAEHIRWELGPKGAPLLVVDGRERDLRAGLRR